VTIVQPGGVNTNVHSSGVKIARPMAVYDGTPAASVRDWRTGGRVFPTDPALPATRIIESVEQETAPLRLALGAGAWHLLEATYADRLRALREQKKAAESVDR